LFIVTVSYITALETDLFIIHPAFAHTMSEDTTHSPPSPPHTTSIHSHNPASPPSAAANNEAFSATCERFHRAAVAAALTSLAAAADEDSARQA
jgi:hypothetical protein